MKAKFYYLQSNALQMLSKAIRHGDLIPVDCCEHCGKSRQRALHGHHEDYRWLAILTEEVGELAQAALHDEFGGKAAGTLRKELIQAAAVCISWLECMERRR